MINARNMSLAISLCYSVAASAAAKHRTNWRPHCILRFLAAAFKQIKKCDAPRLFSMELMSIWITLIEVIEKCTEWRWRWKEETATTKGAEQRILVFQWTLIALAHNMIWFSKHDKYCCLIDAGRSCAHTHTRRKMYVSHSPRLSVMYSYT